MSSTTEAERSFRVSGKTASAGPDQPAGVIRIDSQLMVHVVSAEPAFADLLDHAAITLNESESFRIRVVPPDSKPFSLYKKDVPRDSPEAAEALLTALRKDYGLTLEPIAE